MREKEKVREREKGGDCEREERERGEERVRKTFLVMEF